MLKIFRNGLFVFLITVAIPGHAKTGVGCPPVAEAPNPTPEMIQASTRNARDHGFLWRISKDGRTSFLYGTIHIAKYDWIFPGPSVTQALHAVDTVALELDMSDADIKDRLSRGMGTLRNTTMPEPLVKRMRQLAESVCVPYDAVAKLIPELQIATLSLMEGRREGLDASYAIDSVLAEIGHKAKKNVVSLETPELQLQMLQMHSPQETLIFVQDNLDELETGRSRTMLNRIAKAWANASYNEMEHINEWCECLNTVNERELMKRLLDDRNPALADRIDALHGSGKQVFAAVGSLHMFGPMGLPTLMSKRGYRVEIVELKPL
jgi:uncharacterized protein YbaP (TraB family)